MTAKPLVIISGTNRPGSNTRIIAGIVQKRLLAISPLVEMIDLATFQSDLYSPTSYATKPAWFVEKIQPLVLNAQGIVVVTPEYNGSFPGVLKYFVDMLKFPESLVGIPTAFVGLAAGQFGAMRSVEQLEAIFRYRSAHTYGERLFMPQINEHIQDGTLTGSYSDRLDKLLKGFVKFAAAVNS